MKIIVAGTRTFQDYDLLNKKMHEITAYQYAVTEIVSGCSAGADTLGAYWAQVNNIPVKFFQADWESLGRKAGPIRNSEMAEYADVLIAFWDGESRGTLDTITKMKALQKPVIVIEYKETELELEEDEA